MPFDDLFKFRVFMFLQKIIVNREPEYLFNKLCFLSSSRHCNNLRSIRANYLISERQFFTFSFRLWNSLPNYLKIIRNTVRFKNEIREYIIVN